MSEFQKILEERDELESNIFDLRNKITQCYELIAIKENTIIQLNKKLDNLCDHEWCCGYFQKYDQPEYTCKKCNIKK